MTFLKKMIEYFRNLCYYIFRQGFYKEDLKDVVIMNNGDLNIFNVANFFLNVVDRESGSTITPLKLQKILYYAQGYYLAMNDEELFEEDFEAWAHGPVSPKIYDKYKKYGYNAIDVPKKEEIPIFEENIVDFLNSIWDSFGIYDGKYLEELTHKEEPWLNARKGYQPGQKCNEIISKQVMKEFFKTKINE